jgi:hypothetical protein
MESIEEAVAAQVQEIVTPAVTRNRNLTSESLLKDDV